MGTAPIETRGNEVLELAERLRERRKLIHSIAEGQIVPGHLLDQAIVALVSYGYGAGRMTDADLARFDEAWHDK